MRLNNRMAECWNGHLYGNWGHPECQQKINGVREILKLDPGMLQIIARCDMLSDIA